MQDLARGGKAAQKLAVVHIVARRDGELFGHALAPRAVLGDQGVQRRLRVRGGVLPVLILALAALSLLLFLQIPETVVVHGKEPLQACNLIFRQTQA